MHTRSRARAGAWLTPRVCRCVPGSQLMLALDYCHRKGVANRDIKLVGAAQQRTGRVPGRCQGCAGRGERDAAPSRAPLLHSHAQQAAWAALRASRVVWGGGWACVRASRAWMGVRACHTSLVHAMRVPAQENCLLQNEDGLPHPLLKICDFGEWAYAGLSGLQRAGGASGGRRTRTRTAHAPGADSTRELRRAPPWLRLSLRAPPCVLRTHRQATPRLTSAAPPSPRCVRCVRPVCALPHPLQQLVAACNCPRPAARPTQPALPAALLQP